jgi:uncharacterized protein
MLTIKLNTANAIQIGTVALAAFLMGQLTSPAVAANPSYSCSGNLLPAEAVICSDDNLSGLDRTLAADYKRNMESLPAGQQAELEAVEKAWLAERNSCGPNISCISNAYSVRISQLAAAPKPAPSPTIDTGPVRLRTNFTGAAKCLDIINDGQDDKPTMATCGNFTGQMWTMAPNGTPGVFKFQTQFTGTAKCLDIINDGQDNKPTMATCGNFTGQMWGMSKF